MTTDKTKRARAAYDSFRNGFPATDCPVPEWDKAPTWLIEVVIVAYLHGLLDSTSRIRISGLGDRAGGPTMDKSSSAGLGRIEISFTESKS